MMNVERKCVQHSRVGQSGLARSSFWWTFFPWFTPSLVSRWLVMSTLVNVEYVTPYNIACYVIELWTHTVLFCILNYLNLERVIIVFIVQTKQVCFLILWEHYPKLHSGHVQWGRIQESEADISHYHLIMICVVLYISVFPFISYVYSHLFSPNMDSIPRVPFKLVNDRLSWT